MLLAATKDESKVVHLLDIGAQQGLYVLLWIVSYLLELIYGNDNRCVIRLQIYELILITQNV